MSICAHSFAFFCVIPNGKVPFDDLIVYLYFYIQHDLKRTYITYQYDVLDVTKTSYVRSI